MNKVSLVECDNYKEVSSAIERSLNLIGGLSKYIKEDDVVVISLDLFQPAKPEKQLTTDPAVVRATVKLIKEITPNVFVACLPDENKEGVTKKALLNSGIAKVLKETGVKPFNLETEGFSVEKIDDYRTLEKTDFSMVFKYADAIINLPKLKTDPVTDLSLAVKNLSGLIHPGERLLAFKF